MGLKQTLQGLLSRLKGAPSPAPPDSRASRAATAVPPSPRSAQEYCDRGTERLRSGELDAAIADFSSAIGLDENLAKAYAGRGVALERSGKTDDAKRDYAKSIEIDLRVMLKAEYGYEGPG